MNWLNFRMPRGWRCGSPGGGHALAPCPTLCGACATSCRTCPTLCRACPKRCGWRPLQPHEVGHARPSPGTRHPPPDAPNHVPKSAATGRSSRTKWDMHPPRRRGTRHPPPNAPNHVPESAAPGRSGCTKGDTVPRGGTKDAPAAWKDSRGVGRMPEAGRRSSDRRCARRRSPASRLGPPARGGEARRRGERDAGRRCGVSRGRARGAAAARCASRSVRPGRGAGR